jgi:hypothetical protein
MLHHHWTEDWKVMLLSLQEGLWRSAYFWQMRLPGNLRQEEILEHHEVDSPKNTQCRGQKMWMQLSIIWPLFEWTLYTFIILWRSSMCQLELLKLMFPTESLRDCCKMMIVCISQAIYRSNWRCQCVSFLCAMAFQCICLLMMLTF